jgi:hypothetical protein
MMVSRLLELQSSPENVRKVPAEEVEVDAVAEAAVVVPLDKIVKAMRVAEAAVVVPEDKTVKAVRVTKAEAEAVVVVPLDKTVKAMMAKREKRERLVEAKPRDMVLQET